MIKLTETQRKVGDKLRLGLPNKLIAYELGLTEHTIKIHVKNLCDRLKVHNRTEAAAILIQHNIEPMMHEKLEAKRIEAIKDCISVVNQVALEYRKNEKRMRGNNDISDALLCLIVDDLNPLLEKKDE